MERRGASVRGKLGQSEANLFAKQLAKDLGMPIGQTRKLVWHLHGSMAGKDPSGLCSE